MITAAMASSSYARPELAEEIEFSRDGSSPAPSAQRGQRAAQRIDRELDARHGQCRQAGSTFVAAHGIVQGVATVARREGYRLLLAEPGDAMRGEPVHGTALDALHGQLAEGVISLAHLDEQPETLDALRHLPWMACSEFMPDSGVPYVSTDHRQAAIDAVQYLLNRGHRLVTLIPADETYRWARQQHEGYALALERAGLTVEPELVRTAAGADYAMGAQAAGGLLTLRKARQRCSPWPRHAGHRGRDAAAATERRRAGLEHLGSHAGMPCIRRAAVYAGACRSCSASRQAGLPIELT
jgi:Periplasmic binding proteins and sugar binding domain of LacI family